MQSGPGLRKKRARRVTRVARAARRLSSMPVPPGCRAEGAPVPFETQLWGAASRISSDVGGVCRAAEAGCACEASGGGGWYGGGACERGKESRAYVGARAVGAGG